jgi:hypothetical protein
MTIKKISKKIAVTKDGRYHYWLIPIVGNKFEISMLDSSIPDADPETGIGGVFKNKEGAIKVLIDKYPDITII